MRVRVRGALVLGLLTFSACNDAEKKIVGSWSVDHIEAPFQVINYAINFREDHTCHLPLTTAEHRHTEKEEGTWSAYEKRGIEYVEIKSTNGRFARAYTIVDYCEFRDTISFGTLASMMLVSDSVTMWCTKALYE